MQNRQIRYVTLLFLLLSFITFGCTVIKHYPTDKPFFFENNIKINGSLIKQEKIDIKKRLFSQIEDSAQIKVASKIPWPSFPWLIPSQVMDSPAVYNKLQVLQSVQNMTNSMSSIGYRRSSILLETDTIVKKNQQRVKTSYVVESGPLYKVDSIVYNFEDTVLNSIVKKSTLKSIIYKGKAFDYFSIDQEINRLIELFQNNGYFKISKEDIIAEVDTNYVELLDPMLDAIEYARALAQVMLKRDKPEVDLIFRMRKNIDSNHYYQYRVGQFVVYPDLIETDTLEEVKSDSSFIVIKSLHNTFNSAFIKEQVLLEPGELYKRENYSKTLNNFNKLGAWQNINLSSEPDDEKRLLNYILQLQPAKRQFFGIDMDCLLYTSPSPRD